MGNDVGHSGGGWERVLKLRVVGKSNLRVEINNVHSSDREEALEDENGDLENAFVVVLCLSSRRRGTWGSRD